MVYPVSRRSFYYDNWMELCPAEGQGCMIIIFQFQICRNRVLKIVSPKYLSMKRPFYITEPFLPPLEELQIYLKDIW